MSVLTELVRLDREYTQLCELAKRDVDAANAICDRVFHSFRDVEYDVALFVENKKSLLEALSQ